MKIALLANQVSKNEIMKKPAGTGVGMFWADTIEDLIKLKDADAYFDLEFVNEKSRIIQLAKLLPKPVFIDSVVHTLRQVNQPFIRINAWPGFLERPVCEASVLRDEQKRSAENIFYQLNWQFRFVPDVTGMVSARILAMIINEAYYTLQEKVSTKEEIDIAMKLGANYPLGPFEWGKKIGLKNIYDLLLELNNSESRYKISGLLKKEAIHAGI
jgi:3-hydroxybutyryl-CoA dehydrogenase